MFTDADYLYTWVEVTNSDYVLRGFQNFSEPELILGTISEIGVGFKLGRSKFNPFLCAIRCLSHLFFMVSTK